jgi:uncharacterized protein YhfF
MGEFDLDEIASMPKAYFAFPDPLRDKLVDAILDGRKVSTTGLADAYEAEREPLPRVGERSVVVDSADRPVAVIEVTAVEVVPLVDVDLAHAVDEGEGHTTVASWRRDHEDFWHGAELRAAVGDPEYTVDDSTRVVLERFRLLERLG